MDGLSERLNYWMQQWTNDKQLLESKIFDEFYSILSPMAVQRSFFVTCYWSQKYGRYVCTVEK